MHGHHRCILLKGSTSDTSQLLHVSAAAEKISDMDAKGTNVSASLAANPENTHITVFVVFNELGLIDGSNPEFFLDGGNERRSLEAGTFERVKRLLELLDLVERLVKLDNSNILLTS